MAWQDTPKTTGWGGRRTGAGRKRTTEEPLHARELRLTMPQIAFLNRYGRGNLSAGARQLIDAAIECERDEEATSHEPGAAHPQTQAIIRWHTP